MTEKQQTGASGEAATVEWLRRHGFMIEALNWRSGRDEIDIVATRFDRIHFVEVKTRHSGSMTSPEEAINERKLKALRRCAAAYMAQHRVRLEPQFDLAAVESMPDGSCAVRYVENAMQYGW
ncbi:MAG: YraN family protein [Alistipes sp.]|nr:YraN family protein [Alistipes sp.]